MITVDLKERPMTVDELLSIASSDSLLIRARNGHEYTLEEADDPTARSQPPSLPEPRKDSPFGRMRGTAEIVGDIVSPLSEEDWEVLR